MLSMKYCCIAQHCVWVFGLKREKKGRLITAYGPEIHPLTGNPIATYHEWNKKK